MLVEGQTDGAVDDGGNADAGAVSERPAYIPEAYFDPDTKTVKAEDLTRDLGELPALRELKTAADARAAAIPKDGAYKFELPADFKLPEGTKFIADPKDPLVVGVRELAKTRGWTQDDVNEVTKMWAGMLAGEHEAMKAADAEQMKALGGGAPDRIKAANTWLSGHLSATQAKALGPALRTKDGVEAVEALIEKFKGVKPVGDLNGGKTPNVNADLAENVGKPGGGMALLRASNEKK